MNKILHRGKRVDNDEWIIGYYVKSTYYEGGKTNFIIEVDNKYDDYDAFSLMYEIVAETLGRYTELTDKNSTKIFEGDIVHFESTDELLADFGIVKYGKYKDADSLNDYDYLGWYIEVRVQGEISSISILHLETEGIKMKVIGNIYDNPNYLTDNNTYKLERK